MDPSRIPLLRRPLAATCDPRRRLQRRQSWRRSWLLATVTLLAVIREDRHHFSHGFQTVPTSRRTWHPSVLSPSQFDGRKSRIKLFSNSGSSAASETATVQEETRSFRVKDSSLALNDINATSAPLNGNSALRNGVTVNGAQSKSSSPSINGASTSSGPSDVEQSSDTTTSSKDNESPVLDVPMPTVNGGYTHTRESRAKISAANKGKTPWNKGKARSEEVRARIAAGVRAKNRERFLEKLKTLGITEQEYEQQKKEERRRKDAERRARRTAKGGYRPTKETKEKISKVLREKWANGEMKKRKIDPAKVWRGFTHSEETRAKISASLKARWAQDPTYRENMIRKSHISNSKEDVKKRISVALKKKWQDPDFRKKMLVKINASRNRTSTGPQSMSHREKISAAMKAKWQDEEYRTKTLAAIQKRHAEMAAVRPPKKVAAARPKKKVAAAPVEGIRPVQPVQPKQTGAKAVRRKRKKKPPVLNEDGLPRVVKRRKPQKKKETVNGESQGSGRKESKSSKEAKSKRADLRKEPDGSIRRLREERRDLYDLLYGDDASSGSGVASRLDLGDENLDTFDPYGLDDF